MTQVLLADNYVVSIITLTLAPSQAQTYEINNDISTIIYLQCVRSRQLCY